MKLGDIHIDDFVPKVPKKWLFSPRPLKAAKQKLSKEKSTTYVTSLIIEGKQNCQKNENEKNSAESDTSYEKKNAGVKFANEEQTPPPEAYHALEFVNRVKNDAHLEDYFSVTKYTGIGLKLRQKPDSCALCAIEKITKKKVRIDLTNLHLPVIKSSGYREIKPVKRDIKTLLNITQKADVRKRQLRASRTPPAPPCSAQEMMYSPQDKTYTPDSEYDTEKKETLVKTFLKPNRMSHKNCVSRNPMYSYTAETKGFDVIYKPRSGMKGTVCKARESPKPASPLPVEGTKYDVPKLGLVYMLPESNSKLRNREKRVLSPLEPWMRDKANLKKLPPIKVKS